MKHTVPHIFIFGDRYGGSFYNFYVSETLFIKGINKPTDIFRSLGYAENNRPSAKRGKMAQTL